MSDVPARLKRLGRVVDPNFEPSEQLYRRFHRDHFLAGEVLAQAITFPAFSVNREKYSQANDVLLGYPTYGVLSFPVRGVPAECASPDGRVFRFRVEHVPEEDNYAHSEVRTYSNEERAAKDPPKTVKKLFRTRLFAAFEVLRQPEDDV